MQSQSRNWRLTETEPLLSRGLGSTYEKEWPFVWEEFCHDLLSLATQGDDYFPHLRIRVSLNILSCACELAIARDILRLRSRHRCSQTQMQLNNDPWRTQDRVFASTGRIVDVTVGQLFDRFLVHKKERNNYCLPIMVDFIVQR